MEAYDRTIVAGGHLILSGFLAEDVEILVEKATSLGYELAKRRTNDIWQALVLLKTKFGKA
jgi:ribosomal protein L11 methylase PrmA